MIAAKICILFAVFATGLVTETARGQDALNVELIPKSQKGQGLPQLVVHAQVDLKTVTLRVARASDGKKWTLEKDGISAGANHRFALPMTEVGSERFEGTLNVEMADGGSGTMPIGVDVLLLAPLQLKARPKDVDLPGRTIEVTASRRLVRVEVEIVSDEGHRLGADRASVASPGSDGRQRVTYEQAEGTPLKISIRGFDEDGFFGGVDLFPWRVDIPHEEVHFRSGQHAIDDTEVSKLEASFVQVDAAVKKYGRLAKIRLFVVGHTDTVGPTADNRALSQRRARAIAGWFRRRGVRISIAYAGLGEDRLFIDTPDDTDEPKNRRAEYIVAIEPPSIKDGPVTWKTLGP